MGLGVACCTEVSNAAVERIAGQELPEGEVKASGTQSKNTRYTAVCNPILLFSNPSVLSPAATPKSPESFTSRP